jgi:hypothetical protein
MSEAQKRRLSVDPDLAEQIKEQAIARGKQMKGLPMGGLCKADENHHKAILWKFRSPTGQIIEEWNLNNLVRNHFHLFHPDDVLWERVGNRIDCRAAMRLRHLAQVTKSGEFKDQSWKGWSLIDRTPGCGASRRKSWGSPIGAAIDG